MNFMCWGRSVKVMWLWELITERADDENQFRCVHSPAASTFCRSPQPPGNHVAPSPCLAGAAVMPSSRQNIAALLKRGVRLGPSSVPAMIVYCLGIWLPYAGLMHADCETCADLSSSLLVTAGANAEPSICAHRCRYANVRRINI